MNNFLTWNVQIAAVVAVACLAPWLVRMRAPEARLAFWQSVLGAALLLPLIRPWRVLLYYAEISVTSQVTGIAAGGHWTLPRESVWLIVICTGIAIRLAGIALGLVRLRRYRRASRPFLGEGIRISDGVSSPVTFGFRHPVILLPGIFPELSGTIQEAILCHERLHVRRRDWLFTMAEELLRAVFWFNPAIWWLLGQIQLTREQTVDRKVVAETGSADTYLEALLAIAGTVPQIDLQPAPLFLRRRHLKKRVFSLLKEPSMSRTKSLKALAAGLGLIAATCWFITNALPLTAAEPQKIRLGGNVAQQNLVSQPKPAYPPEAKRLRIQGVVELTVDINEEGKVTNIAVVSGPDELVQSAVDAVWQWEYKPVLLNGQPVAVITTVDINYTLSQ